MPRCHRDPWSFSAVNKTPAPFNREPRRHCCRFLPAPSGRSAPFEATGRPKERGGGSSCPRVPLFWGGCFKAGRRRGAKKKKERKKKADGCSRIVSDVARGWHRGFPPGCFDTSFSPPNGKSLRNYQPSGRSRNSHSASENVQENTGRSSWPSARRRCLQKRTNALFSFLLFLLFPLKTSPGDGIYAFIV